MTGRALVVDHDALDAVAAELLRCSRHVGDVGQRLLASFAVPGLDLLATFGPLGPLGALPALLDARGCCDPAGLPAVATALAALAVRVRVAAGRYAAADAAGAGALPLVDIADTQLVPTLRALTLVATWDLEHRLVPATMRRPADDVLDAIDRSIEGVPSVHRLSPDVAARHGLDGSLGGLAASSVTGAFDGVRLLGAPDLPSTFAVVRTAAGPPPLFVACLPGLQRWWGADRSAADLPGAIATLTGHSGYVAGVRRVLLTLPRGSEVMLVGHSQGGMVAQALAADGRLRSAGVRIEALTTAGSPPLADEPPAGVAYLALENAADPIPRLRWLATGVLLPPIPHQRAPGRVVVRFPATHRGLTLANHQLDEGGYLSATTSSRSPVTAFRLRTRRFFTGTALSTAVYQVTDGGRPWP
jgi:pimeloyl-ACP methyl ester carboxylesterase